MARLIALTKIVDEDLLEELKDGSSEELIMYCARVSNPNNQTSGNTKLLDYCAKQKHWSIFEMSNMVIKVETSRAIAQQILRHRSFSFQEFSQRYAKAQEIIKYPARRQDDKNRQNSLDDMDEKTKLWFDVAQDVTNKRCVDNYEEALRMGIAKEQARFLLPLSTKTVLFMSGSIRSWVHYIDLRSGVETQKEHRDIAMACKNIFCEQFPNIAKSLDWDKVDNLPPIRPENTYIK